MKKRWIKRAIVSGLALTLAVGGLSACGGSGVDKQKNALAKENVYSFQEYSLPNLGGDYTNMMGSFHGDGRVYVLMQVEHYGENYYTSYHIVSFQEDGTDVQQVTLELNEVVLTEEEMGGSGQGNGEDSIGWSEDVIVDGIMPLSAAAQPEEPEDEADEDMDADADVDIDTDTDVDTDIDADMDVDDDFFVDDDMFVDGDVWDAGEDWDNIYESSYLGNLSYVNGAIYGVRNYYYYNYSTGYDLNKTFICSWNLDGTVKWEFELENSQNMWVRTMAAASDGTLTILLSEEDTQYMLSVSAEGQMGERKKISDKVKDALNSVQLIQSTQNGTFFMIYSDMNDWTKQYAAEYDPVTDTFSDPVDIPSSVLYAQSGMMKVGENSDLIYHTNSGLYTYNIGDEEGTKRMDYINSDLYITSLQDVIELDDTHFVGMFYENYDWGNLKAGLFTYIPPEDIQDKNVMVLAGMWLDRDIKQRVIEFNRNNQEYRITIKDYSEYNSYDDYEAGQNQMNNDIVTGNMPDILVVNSNMPIENYIAKGWLADINDLIKKDEELSQVEFVQNVFDAYSVKGKLYYVIPSFYASTMIAKTSIVGDRTSWTMDDMIELQKSLPEGTNMMENMTRSNFLGNILMYCGNDFIDVETGKCSFDSEAFIDLMEYAKTFPEEIVYDDSYWDGYWENYQSQYREDRTILMSAYISSATNFRYNLNGTFGEEISYIGFPTSAGMGAFVCYNEAYCISARSRNKDGAWEFLRYYLTDEYQNSDNRYSFSVHKDIFEAEAQEAMERPYWLDENGNKHEYDDTYYMNGEEIVIEPLTQEQVDKLVNYIYTIDNAYYYNTDIVNIIQEEIDAFFTDQKEAAEVANIIQRRAQVYVDENR